MQQQEILSHAGIRGVAALGVVFHHYKQNLNPALDLDRYTLIFEGAGAFVDLFFVLSGFIIAASYNSWFATSVSWPEMVKFLRKRIARIYPLHLATLGVSLVLVAKSGGITQMSGDIVENILFIHAWGMNDVYVLNFPSWSVSAEWMLYLLFPAFAFAFARPRYRQFLLGFMIVAYVSLFILADGLNLNERLSLWRAIPAFILGMALFWYRAAAADLTGPVVTGLQIASLALIGLLLHTGAMQFLLVPCFAVLVLTTCQDQGPVSALFGWRPLVFLGAISYSIYMLHVPVRGVMFLVFGKLGLPLEIPQYAALFVTVCLAGTIVTGILSYTFFEKPMRSWIGKPRS